MPTIIYDTELLRQPWEEKLLDGVLDFGVVHDSLSRPIIFTLHRDGKLLLLAQDGEAEFKVLDLSKQLGLKESEKVSAFAVSQARNLDIYLAFATKNQDETTSSKIWILPALSPASPNWIELIEPNLAFKGPSTSSNVVSKLLLVSASIN